MKPLIQYVRLHDEQAVLTIASPAMIRAHFGTFSVAECRLATDDDVAFFKSKGIDRPEGGRIKGEPL